MTYSSPWKHIYTFYGRLVSAFVSSRIVTSKLRLNYEFLFVGQEPTTHFFWT